MRAGRLRHRVVLQRPTEARDAHGQPVKTWVTLATVWAGVEPLRGRERESEAQTINEEEVRVPIRYLSSVTVDCRVSFENRIFEIRRIEDPDMRHREMHLYCKEIR